MIQGYLSIYNGIYHKHEKEIRHESNLISIMGNTNLIQKHNVYARLQESNLGVVIPYVESSYSIHDVIYTIIGTDEDYFDYFIDEHGAYHNYILNLENNDFLISKVIVNSKALELISNNIVTINQHDLMIAGTFSDNRDEPIIIMNFNVYDDYIESISEFLMDGGQVYHFPIIYVISNDHHVLDDIFDIIDFKENGSSFKVLTIDRILKDLMSSSGLTNEFSKNMIKFIGISLVLVMVLIIGMSYKRNKSQYLLRVILGEMKTKLMFEFVIENILVQGFIYLITTLMIFTVIVILQSVNSIFAYLSIGQIVLGYLCLTLIDMVISCLIFTISMPKNQLIQRR